jgi:hypothetical protein
MSFLSSLGPGPQHASNTSIPNAMPGTNIASKARSTPTTMSGPDFGPGSGFDVLGLGRFDTQPNFKSRAAGGVLSTVPVAPTQFQASTNDLSQFQGRGLLQSMQMPNYLMRG